MDYDTFTVGNFERLTVSADSFTTRTQVELCNKF